MDVTNYELTNTNEITNEQVLNESKSMEFKHPKPKIDGDADDHQGQDVQMNKALSTQIELNLLKHEATVPIEDLLSQYMNNSNLDDNDDGMHSVEQSRSDSSSSVSTHLDDDDDESENDSTDSKSDFDLDEDLDSEDGFDDDGDGESGLQTLLGNQYLIKQLKNDLNNNLVDDSTLQQDKIENKFISKDDRIEVYYCYCFLNSLVFIAFMIY